MKCIPGGSRICICIKFEAMSGSIDSVDLKLALFLMEVIPPKLTPVSYFISIRAKKIQMCFEVAA